MIKGTIFDFPRFNYRAGFVAGIVLFLLILTTHPVHASQDRFGGVFQEGTDPHNLLSGMTWNELGDKMAEFGKKKQKLVDVEIIQRESTDPERRCEPPTFAGVWREGDYEQSLIGGLVWNDFNKQHKIQQKKYGMRLIDIETHVECGVRKYVGVFSKGSQSQTVKTGMSWVQLTNKFSSMHKAGRHLVDIETYEDNSKRYWAAIWDKGYKDEWLLALPRKEFEDKFFGGTEQLVDMESWRDEGGRQIAGLFYGSPNAAIMEIGENWQKFIPLWEQMSENQQRLVDLEVYPDTTDRRWENTFFQALNGKAMGWSFAVMESGFLAEAGAHGWARSPNETVNPSIPMNPALAMNVASVTKLLTVVGILKINEEMGNEEMGWNWFINMPFAAWLQAYYPDSTFGEGVWDVTIRDLMTQKTGMQEPDDDGKDFYALGSNYKERIGEWLKMDLVGTPGAGDASYYNHYFNLLVMVIEAATGKNYEKWMNDNIFYPIGIGPLACGPKDLTNDPLYYKELPDNGPGVYLSKPGDNCFDGPDGMGGAWYASPIDMARFIAAFRDGSILEPATIQMMESEIMAWYWHDDPSYPEVLGQKNGGLAKNGSGMGTDVMALIDQFDVAITFNSWVNNFSSEQLILDAYHAPEDW